MKNININLALLLLFSLSACQKPIDHQIQGKVKRSALSIVSKHPGRIKQYFVNEGSKVNAGDTLMELHFPEVEAKLHQANGALNAAKAQYDMALKGATNGQLKQISAKLQASKEQYQFASKSYQRVESLYADSLISGQKHDEAHMKYIGAKAQYDATLAQYQEIKQGIRDEKIRMALGTMERAEGAVEEAQIAFSERFLTAPHAMSIETIALQTGELALPGYGLVSGYREDAAFFRFTIPEHDRNKYGQGQEIQVRLPFENNVISAKIVAIKALTRYAQNSAASPQYDMGESIYEIKAVPVQDVKNIDLPAQMSVLIEK